MSTVPAATKVSNFSCYCLNIQVHASDIDQSPPFAVETGYLPVYVRDEGIHIAHDQFTSRTHGQVRQSEVPQRSVTLTCLMCTSDVYRVWWDHKPSEGAPISPERITTEGGILQSSSGWIEVKQTCLSGESVQRLRDSPEYSALFNVVIAQENPTPPASLSSRAPITAPPLSPATPPLSSTHLPDLPPLFFPPPFTPSHAAFVRLKELATAQSLQLRHHAEAELVEATKKKLADLEQAEQELRRQVLILWRAFRNHTGEDDTKVQQQPVDGTRVRAPAKVIRDFSPPADGGLKWNPKPSKVQHSSALSQSMRMSGMHYVPKASANDDSDPSGVAQSVPFEAPSRRWVTTEDTNIAASLHWSKMEENMRGEHEKRQKERKHKSEVKVATPAKTSVKKSEAETSQVTDTPDQESKNKNTDGKQGSRKVQFDVKPTVTSAETGTTDTVTKSSAVAPEESVFDIEFEDAQNADAGKEPVEPAPAPIVTSGPSSPINARRKHKANPLSFSSLRPSSLPAPSVLNAAFKPKQPLPPSNPPSTSSSSSTDSKSRLASLPPGIRNHVPEESLGETEDQQNSTIIDGPSSVPSGSKNGRSWAIFTRNKGGKMTFPEDTIIAEEAEDELTSVASKSVADPEEDDSATQFTSDPASIGGFPRSMPIPTNIPGARAFEDPDYEAKTSLTDQPGYRVPKLSTAGLPSSVAIRKALYAQRDRQRGTDPGSFDDIGEEGEGDDSDQDDETLADGAPTERSRQKAFKILKAREELPAAGMWRSLAN